MAIAAAPAAAVTNNGSASPRRTAPEAGQSLQRAWPIGTETAWVWTQNLAGGPQALERSTDGGKDWTDVTPPGLDQQIGNRFISDFYGLDADHAWVVYGGVASSAAQIISSTSDGGRHWRVIGRRPSTYGCDLQFVTPTEGWCTVIGPAAGSESVELYRTLDGGKHWAVVSETSPSTVTPAGSLPFGCDKDIQFVNPSTGWAVFACAAGVASLYETTNGGKTWVSRAVAAPSGALEYGSGFVGIPVLDGADGAVGYTISGPSPKSVAYVSSDAGASWHPVTPPGPPEPWLVDVINPLRWRLVHGDRILGTDDAGRSWYTITSDVSFKLYYSYLSPTPPVVDFATRNVGWIVSSSLWRTTDGGSTWLRVAVPGT